MKVLMIGTKTCHNCKSIRPNIEEYCSDKSIEFQYHDMMDISPDLMELIMKSGIKQAPVFFIVRGDKTNLISGDNIFVELETIN